MKKVCRLGSGRNDSCRTADTALRQFYDARRPRTARSLRRTGLAGGGAGGQATSGRRCQVEFHITRADLTVRTIKTPSRSQRLRKKKKKAAVTVLPVSLPALGGGVLDFRFQGRLPCKAEGL